MSRVFLSAGHSNNPKKDRGASALYQGNLLYEGVETAKFVTLLALKLKEKGIEVVVDDYDTVLADTIANFRGKVKPNDIVIEYHFNAGGGTGVETFVPNAATSFEKTLGAALSASIAAAMDVRIRGMNGVKTEAESARKRLGLMTIPCQNALVEICFIDNPSDMKKYFTNLNKIIDMQSDAIINAVRSYR